MPPPPPADKNRSLPARKPLTLSHSCLNAQGGVDSGETAGVRMTSKKGVLGFGHEGEGDFRLPPTLCSDVMTHFCDVCISCPFALISLPANAEK